MSQDKEKEFQSHQNFDDNEELPENNSFWDQNLIYNKDKEFQGNLDQNFNENGEFLEKNCFYAQNLNHNGYFPPGLFPPNNNCHNFIVNEKYPLENTMFSPEKSIRLFSSNNDYHDFIKNSEPYQAKESDEMQENNFNNFENYIPKNELNHVQEQEDKRNSMNFSHNFNSNHQKLGMINSELDDENKKKRNEEFYELLDKIHRIAEENHGCQNNKMQVESSGNQNNKERRKKKKNEDKIKLKLKILEEIPQILHLENDKKNNKTETQSKRLANFVDFINFIDENWKNNEKKLTEIFTVSNFVAYQSAKKISKQKKEHIKGACDKVIKMRKKNIKKNDSNNLEEKKIKVEEVCKFALDHKKEINNAASVIFSEKSVSLFGKLIKNLVPDIEKNPINRMIYNIADLKPTVNKALQRDSGEQIFECENDNDTSCFFRDGEWMGESGDQTGKCGTKKDHRRVYVCKTCYNNGKRP